MPLITLLVVTPPTALVPAWALGAGLVFCVTCVVVLSVVKRGRKP